MSGSGSTSTTDDAKQRLGGCSELEDSTRCDDQGASAGTSSTSERRVTRAAARSQNQQKEKPPAKERPTKVAVESELMSCTFM